MVEARAGIEVQAWRDAYREIDEASVEAGFPYRARCLYWEAVAAAATAAGESPADREPTDVLWGAAATRAFAGALSPLTAPSCAGRFEPAAPFFPIEQSVPAAAAWRLGALAVPRSARP
jgi:hypothetical protein